MLVPQEATTNQQQPERLTEELLARLLASATPDAYLAAEKTDDRTLSDYLLDLIDEHNVSRADVVRGSAVNSTFVYQVFNGTRKIGRDNAIKLAFGIGCTLRETQRLLRHAGVSELWCKNRRDAIIIYAVDNGYSLAECDDELYRLGEATLVSMEG